MNASTLEPRNSKKKVYTLYKICKKCLEGYHGYRCMESGSFPFAVVMTVTPTVGIVLTAGLWYIGRRHVIKQDRNQLTKNLNNA